MLRWLVLVLLVSSAGGCRSSGGIAEIPLGTRVATRGGNVVTVAGWKGASPELGADDEKAGLELESCRTRPSGLLLDAGNFSLLTASGAVLPPRGSDFTASGDCVSGMILFALPGGDRPVEARFRAGPKALRWNLFAKPS